MDRRPRNRWMNGVRLTRVTLALVGLTSILSLAGCRPFPNAPATPAPDHPLINGTWTGTHTVVVVKHVGPVPHDTTYTVATTLTLVIQPGMISFTDSEAGQLPTQITVLDNDRAIFTVTDGLTTWTETGTRTGDSINGTERVLNSSAVAGVWAVTRQ
jgi:hypothetical protein